MSDLILVLSGNPRKDSFTHFLAETYVKTAKEAGHEVIFEHVPSLDMHAFGPTTKMQDDEIRRQQQLILRAKHIVVVTPVWFYAFPAALKSYFEQTLTPGFAYNYPHPWPLMSHFLPRRGLKGRSVRMITTQDSFRMIGWLMGNPFLISIPLSIFFYVGMFPIRHTAFTRVRASSLKKRQRWIKKVERLARKGK